MDLTVLCFKELFTGYEMFTLYFLTVEMTVLRQAGDHRYVLCRMMFPLNPQIFYQPGHFRAIGFSAAVFSFLHRRQHMIRPAANTPQLRICGSGTALSRGIRVKGAGVLCSSKPLWPWLLSSQSSLAWKQDRILLPHFVPFSTSQHG